MLKSNVRTLVRSAWWRIGPTVHTWRTSSVGGCATSTCQSNPYFIANGNAKTRCRRGHRIRSRCHRFTLCRYPVAAVLLSQILRINWCRVYVDMDVYSYYPKSELSHCRGQRYTECSPNYTDRCKRVGLGSVITRREVGADTDFQFYHFKVTQPHTTALCLVRSPDDVRVDFCVNWTNIMWIGAASVSTRHRTGCSFYVELYFNIFVY